MGKTTSAAKQDWNAKHYSQIKVSVKPEIAVAFKSACEAAGVSMASTLSGFMESYAALPVKRSSTQILTTTRRHRRNAFRSLLNCLEQIRDAEESYRDNIPENLSGSAVYETADECVEMLSEAIGILESAYQ